MWNTVLQMWRREPHEQAELLNILEHILKHGEASVMAYQHEQCIPWELPGSLEVVLVDDVNSRVDQNACQHCQRDLCCQGAQACTKGSLETTTDLDDGHNPLLRRL